MTDWQNRIEIDPRLQRLLELIIELREEEVHSELKKLLNDGMSAHDILSCCMEGMRQIGDRFESGTYFIAALIMAGEIMQSATGQLTPYLSQEEADREEGRIILGTVQGDIHDLGKNLFSILLKCNGFKIIDLGVDVSAEKFLEQAEKLKPDIIGISCVLTSSITNLKETLTFLKEKLPDPKIPLLIGGTCVDEHVAEFVESPHWAKDAADGLKVCQRIVRESGKIRE